VSDSVLTSLPSSPLRVLHVLEATLGGTLRYMENIAEATRGLNVESGFAYGTARADSRLVPFLELIERLGWRSYPVDMRREVRPSQDVKAWFQLRAAVKDFAPHILHCHSSKAGALGRTVVLGMKDRPARIYSPHALAASLGSFYLSIEKMLAGLTEQFVAVSETERKEIESFSLADKDSISVVYPWVDSTYFQPASRRVARQKLSLGAGPLVVAIGRLTAQKDPLAFLRVMELVHAQEPDVKAVWVGAGEGEAAFVREIRRAGMDFVIRVVPWQHDVRTYIAASDVFLSTSKFESFGYVTAEALAMSRPVVATDVTGTRDIMLNKLGEWMFASGRPDVAARLVLEMLRDPMKSAALGELGRTEVNQRFSTDRMRESLMQAYRAGLKPTSVESVEETIAA
jgi:glycosyltransferase involved in cell wall biosynthesis